MASDDGAAGGPERLARISASDRSLISKSSLTFASRVVGKLTQFAWLIIAARLLSADEFAQYGYVVAVALAFCVLGDAGVGTIAGREMASGSMSPARAFWTAAPLVAVIGLAVSALFGLFLLVGSGPGVTPSSILAGSAFVLGNRLLDLCATSLRAVGRIELEAALQIVNAVLFVALATAVAVAGGGVALVLAVLAAKELASAAVAAAAIRADIGPPLHVPLRSTLELLRPGLMVSLGSFGLAVCTRTPLVVLGNVGTPAQVAYYSAAVRFADTALMLSVTAGFGLMPGLANVQARDVGRARRLIGRALVVVALVGVAVAIPAVVLRERIATIVFGGSFAPAGAPLGVLMAGLPILAVTGVAWFALLALRRERVVFAAAYGGVAVSLILSLLLADRPVGAAIAYVAGVGAVALVLLLGVHGRASPTAAPSAGATAREVMVVPE